MGVFCLPLMNLNNLPPSSFYALNCICVVNMLTAM
ncbi:hypothetical protein EASG_04406 [Escherichia coli H383]|nr:hypothetical protein EASG_04406 [Escherichia coli H383]